MLDIQILGGGSRRTHERQGVLKPTFDKNSMTSIRGKRVAAPVTTDGHFATVSIALNTAFIVVMILVRRDKHKNVNKKKKEKGSGILHGTIPLTHEATL